MKTRIKYHKKGKNYTSEYCHNYKGETLLVLIHFNQVYTMHILNKAGDVLEKEEFKTAQQAKRNARKLLINKYEIRLNDEIRMKT